MNSAELSAGPSSSDVSLQADQLTPPIVRGEPREVADGVFVIPDNRVDVVPNVGIVVGERAVLVIDSGLGRRNGRYVLDQAKRLAAGRPLYLTITHFHPEHGFGAMAFKGESTIIYNAGQRDELHRKGPAYVELFSNLAPTIAAELRDVELTDPDVVYADGHAEIDLGGHRATLNSWRAAHTTSDQTIVVDNRVLFAGDLLETRMFPIVPFFPPFDTDVDPKGWIEVLDDLLALDPELVVPGHGEVNDSTLISHVRDYLVYVRDEAARLRESGASIDETAATIDRSARARWSTWDHPEWIDFAARVFYRASAEE